MDLNSIKTLDMSMVLKTKSIWAINEMPEANINNILQLPEDINHQSVELPHKLLYKGQSLLFQIHSSQLAHHFPIN